MSPRTLDDLTHGELADLVREYLLAGHLIDRAGMPVVTARGIDAMREVAIDEWMGASPIYTKRIQRLLDFERPTVETCLKGIQLDIGAPPEFMDFRMEIVDDHHGAFHLDHCGALMDVEPMGEDFVVTMCHHIEDPTFDATGWATHPKLRMRPVHRPPRTPAGRQPHCAWTVVIDESVDDNPEPEMTKRVARSRLAQLPVATIGDPDDGDDGRRDYSGPLNPDLQMRDFARPVLRALADEISVQAHLLVLAFGVAVEDRTSTEDTIDAINQQFTGVAGVVAARLRHALHLGDEVNDVATVFALHPAFHPRSYVAWDVSVDGGDVVLALGECPARHEDGYTSWITLLSDGYDRALSSIAAAVDPHWHVARDGGDRWRVSRTADVVAEFPEVALTRFSTGATHVFIR